MKKVSYNILIFLIFALFIFFQFDYKRKNTIENLSNSFKTWESELTLAALNNNTTYLEKFIKTIYSSEIKSIKLYKNRQLIISFPYEENKSDRNSFFKNTFFLKRYGLKVSEIQIDFSIKSLLVGTIFSTSFLATLLLIVLVYYFSSINSLKNYKNLITKSVKMLNENMNNPDIFMEKLKQLKISKSDNILQEYVALIVNLFHVGQENEKVNFQLKLSEKISNISSQVAHDIRSPLSALDMMMKDMSALPEDKRLIIRSSVTRIQDIANDLLTKNRQLKRNEDLSEIDNKTEKVLLSSVIETLLSEKRIQFRPKVNISIESKLGEQAYGIFAEINSREFKRVLSNLINNAVEAFKDDTGHIEVSLKGHDDNALLLSIKDNGSGIPEQILAKLGQRGETHGKTGGSGLGLYHAKSMIESWKGNLTIESSVGEGTIINIMLPKSTPPKTFIPQITLRPGMTVVAIDDDNSIHQIWKGRLESVKASESNISLISFSGIDEFNNWAQNNKADLYLVDYEFIGNKLSGIDLIKKWNLQDKAILVTSRYEEKNTISSCENLNIKLLPKGLAGFIPFTVGEESQVEAKKSTSILLDDDMLIRMTWQMSAKEKNIALEIFEEPKQLFDNIDQFSCESTFYIDSNLSDGQKGEDVAKALSQAGFTNLYLATGYEAEQFQDLEFLKGVIGKDAPWQ